MKSSRQPKKNIWNRHRTLKALGVIAALTGLQALFINASPVNSPFSQKAFARGQILVQPKAGLSQDELDKVLSRQGGRAIGKIHQINVHIVQVPSGAEEAVVAALAHNPVIKFAEVDGKVKSDAIPNDPYYSSQWHLPMIGAPAAWDLTQGSGITIAILDSGVAPTHPDLAGKLVAGYNFVDNNTDTSDVFGHGTVVAGAAAAIGNNSIGVAGVATNALIMPVRVSDSTGYAYWSTMATGLTWAADHGARVANMSFSAYQSSAVTSAAQYLKSKGGLAVSSAGNTGTLDSTPASDSILVVSATDSADARASWSTYGPAVDLSAPGVGIYTTDWGGAYRAASGTSLSAPVTAGTIALMMSANPKLTADQISNLLLSTAHDLGDAGWDQYFGKGRIDAAAAVQAAASAVALDTQSPSVSFSSPSNGSVVKGLISISLAASDNTGVTHVDLYAGGVLVGSDLSAPYSYSLDTTQFADGTLSLTAKAYDSAGNMGTSSINLSVRNTVDTTAPVVQILSPSTGAILNKSSVSISAAASDNVGVASMAIYVDGVKKASSTSGSISTSLSTRKLSTGSHTIRVDAVDSSGNASSSSIQVSK